MTIEWVRSPSARRILVHWADSRPAWLWSADGGALVWRNAAAPYFDARVKKAGLKLAPEPVPIKGQVPRLIRLGSPGRSSLSRMQFLAGGRPVSTTCAVTPVMLADGQPGLLVVAVDPLEPDVLALRDLADSRPASLLPPDIGWLLLTPEGGVAGGTPGVVDQLGGEIDGDTIAGLSADGAAEIELGGGQALVSRFKASPQDHQLLLIEREAPRIDEVRAEDGLAAADDLGQPAPAGEPLLPMDLPAEPSPVPPEPTATEPSDDAPVKPESGVLLSSLFDRLAEHESLFGDLTAADEHFLPPPARIQAAAADAAEPLDTRDRHAAEQVEIAASVAEPASPEPVAEHAADVPSPAPAAAVPQEPEARPQEPDAPVAEPDDAQSDGPTIDPGEPDVIAAVIAFTDDLDDDPRRDEIYRVTGRGFTPLEGLEPGVTQPADEGQRLPEPDIEVVERVSRYNFDELSRILTDRVGGSEPAATDRPAVEAEPAPDSVRPAVAEGALINIAAETFILNRLPLGILVFRDQQVLFANRALTDLVGHESIDALRAAGIAAIFPADDRSEAGPVTHLVRRDGTRFPVTARLQSITWHGRPALMLSAAPTEIRTGHEGAVRAFAETLAGTRQEGFVFADRSGVVTQLSAAARRVLNRTEEAIGQPLAALVHPDDVTPLRAFLEKPARFAETARPSIVVRGMERGSELVLFAEGQAGIVAGYFGFALSRRQPAPADTSPTREESVDPAMLARISRGVRRPLNTIVGFADLIRSASFGTVENHRYLEYARDIKTAGQEIAVLVDELDEYARLAAGRYATRPAELDLIALLDSCVVRVRGQAGAARVLVRSAISERLPHVRADRASLGQAVLNLLASAIDQTPAGGSVIVSAQPADDGGIVVNVRDSGALPTDLGDRFVVFRDGVSKEGDTLSPVRSSVGLALTRALINVNGCTLSVDPAGAAGTLFSLGIPAELVAASRSA